MSKALTDKAANDAQNLIKENRHFSEKLIRSARAGRGSAAADTDTTYVEDVVNFFSKGIGSPMFQPYVNYALRSIDRGEKICRQYEAEVRCARRYLDIGCAYGGVVIAVAKRGAPQCIGVEYDARLLKLADKLALEHNVSNRVSFRQGDLTRTRDMQTIGEFDLITCIDVLEHVLKPAAAIRSLSRLAAPGSTVVIDVPNPTSHQLILKDPHHHIPGSVLLSRKHAIRVFENKNPGNKRYTVGYFRALEWYLRRLARAGFECTIQDKIPDGKRAVAATIKALDNIKTEVQAKAAAESWPSWRVKLVGQALNRFLRRVARDKRLARISPSAFQKRYAVPVYHLHCRKMSRDAATPSENNR